MTKSEGWILTALLGTTTLALLVIPPDVPRDARAIIYLVLCSFWIGYAIYFLSKRWAEYMSTPLLIGIGGLLGLFAGFVVALAFPKRPLVNFPALTCRNCL